VALFRKEIPFINVNIVYPEYQELLKIPGIKNNNQQKNAYWLKRDPIGTLSGGKIRVPGCLKVFWQAFGRKFIWYLNCLARQILQG
jgi:hypothetical protein